MLTTSLFEGEDLLHVNLTFALRRVLPARPNYIWFVCNTYHAKKARNSLSEDLPSFLSSRFLACCCFPCFCAAPRERRTARFTATSAWWRIAACPAPDPCSAPTCIWARSPTSSRLAWRKTLEVFDEDQQDYRTMSLFPDDREVPADALDSIQVKLSGLELRRPRTFGACWLGCELWQQLGLDEFWQQRLPEAREAVSWEKVLQLQVVNCLLDPGSDYRLHRQWYVDTAMDELLETDFAVAAKDRLYRCLDRILPYKQELFIWLKPKWADLLRSDF